MVIFHSYVSLPEGIPFLTHIPATVTKLSVGSMSRPTLRWGSWWDFQRWRCRVALWKFSSHLEDDILLKWWIVMNMVYSTTNISEMVVGSAGSSLSERGFLLSSLARCVLSASQTTITFVEAAKPRWVRCDAGLSQMLACVFYSCMRPLWKMFLLCNLLGHFQPYILRSHFAMRLMRSNGNAPSTPSPKVCTMPDVPLGGGKNLKHAPEITMNTHVPIWTVYPFLSCSPSKDFQRLCGCWLHMSISAFSPHRLHPSWQIHFIYVA